MTQFEKIISKYTDADQYFNTAGFYHVATRASEIETRKLIDNIVEREGYTDGLQEDKYSGGRARTTFLTDDRRKAFHAIPRTFYKQTKDGNIEVDKVEVAWYEYIYDYDTDGNVDRYPVEEKETIIDITADDEARLKELVLLADNARKDFDALKRTAVNNLFNAEGISTAGDATKADDTKEKVQALQEYADALIEAVSKEDAERLQEVQYKQITQHWQIVANTDDETKAELIRFFSTQHYAGYKDDEANKARQLACVYSNFVNNYVTTIPETYIEAEIHGRYIIVKGKEERTAEEEEQLLLLRGCRSNIREKLLTLSHRWFNEVGGIYVTDEEEKPEAEEEAIQRFADREAVIQDYTSPTRQIYALSKAGRVIFDDPELADEITALENGQLQFKFAVSKPDAKVERAVILEITDKIYGITKFDKTVMSAVYSIIEAGNTSFTSKQVAIHYTQNSRPSPNTVGAVTKSIEKLSTIKHRLDVTEHYKMMGVDLDEMGVEEVKRGGYLLPVEDIEITMNNGAKVKGYSLIKRPVLLDYAKDTKQIHTVDVEVLDVPVNKTEKVVIMRDYLIQQIGIIYNPHGRINNNILISTVLDYAGHDLLTMDRRRKNEQVGYIKKMIEYWNKIKYIEYGYKYNYKGKTLESITIYPRPKKK